MGYEDRMIQTGVVCGATVKFPEVARVANPGGVRIAFYFLARAVEVYASQNFSRWRNRSDRQKAWTATPRVGYEVFGTSVTRAFAWKGQRTSSQPLWKWAPAG